MRPTPFESSFVSAGMTKRNYADLGVDIGQLLQQNGKRQESILPESILPDAWVSDKLTKIQEAVWEGGDNFDSLEALLSDFNTVQRAKPEEGAGVNCLKTVEVRYTM